MTVTSEFSRLVRLQVRGDFDAHRQLTAELDQRHGWDGYAEYLGAAFFIAVERRFRPGQDAASIIRFVAEARAQFDETGSDIDPVAAETLIRAALGERDASGIDARTVGAVETVLLHKLLTDENMSDERLDAFLAEANELTRRGSGSAR